MISRPIVCTTIRRGPTFPGKGILYWLASDLDRRFIDEFELFVEIIEGDTEILGGHVLRNALLLSGRDLRLRLRRPRGL